MLGKLKAFWEVLQAGKSVADPVAWKTKQLKVNVLIAFFTAIVNLAKAFGYDLHLDYETINSVSVAILALVNWVLTLSTSDKVGFKPENTEDTK